MSLRWGSSLQYTRHARKAIWMLSSTLIYQLPGSIKNPDNLPANHWFQPFSSWTRNDDIAATTSILIERPNGAQSPKGRQPSYDHHARFTYHPFHSPPLTFPVSSKFCKNRIRPSSIPWSVSDERTPPGSTLGRRRPYPWLRATSHPWPSLNDNWSSLASVIILGWISTMGFSGLRGFWGLFLIYQHQLSQTDGQSKYQRFRLQVSNHEKTHCKGMIRQEALRYGERYITLKYRPWQTNNLTVFVFSRFPWSPFPLPLLFLQIASENNTSGIMCGLWTAVIFYLLIACEWFCENYRDGGTLSFW